LNPGACVVGFVPVQDHRGIGSDVRGQFGSGIGEQVLLFGRRVGFRVSRTNPRKVH